MKELPHGLFWRGKKIWVRYTDPETNKQTFKTTGTGDVALATVVLTETKQQIEVLRSRSGRKRKRKPKDEIGIYQRGNIYWCRWTDASGKKHEISSRSDDFDVAKDLLARKKLASSAQKFPEFKNLIPEHSANSKTTFKVFFEKRYEPSFKGQNAFADKKYLIQKFIIEYGHLPINDINAGIFLDFRDDVLKPLGIKSSTRNRYRTALLHVMSFAKGRKLISLSQLDELYNDFDKEGESSPNFLPLTDDEVARLIIQVCKKPHLHEIVVFATYTGWRSGSIKNLTWDNVDEERGQVRHPPKNPSAPWVDTPITGPVMWVLERRKLAKKGQIPYVFYNPTTDTAWSDLRTSWNTAKKNAGILNKRISFHSLRGTFARALEDNGLPISEIQKLLGHTSLATTMRYLQRLQSTRDTRKDLMKLFPSLRYDGSPEEAWKTEHEEWEKENRSFVPDVDDQELDWDIEDEADCNSWKEGDEIPF